MPKRIIFKNTDGSIGILIPSQDAIDKFGITAIARKDTPVGLPYKIIDTSSIPADRTMRNAWKLPDDIQWDGFGAQSSEFEGV